MRKNRGVYENVRGSGIWWTEHYDAEGRRRREKVGRKSDAIAYYQKRKSEALQGKKLPEKLRAKPVTFAELAQDALEYSKAHKLSYDDDVYRMKPMQERFGDRIAEALTPQNIERWLTDQTNLKNSTLNRYLALISLTYRLGNQNGKVKCNPARLIRRRREDNGRIRWLLAEEEHALKAVVQERYVHHLPELDLAINTGLRLGEQYRLTWDNVDFPRRALRIPLSKNGDARYVPLNDAALAALRTAYSFSNSQDFVFLNRYGQRLVGPREWFDTAVEVAGLKEFTWHCLRHTFASRLVMAGVDLRTVQELLGHRTIQMTVRYAHLAPKHQLAAVQRLCDTGNDLDRATATTTATSDSGEAIRFQ